MSRDEIFSKVRALMVEMFEFSPREITENAKLFEDLDLDSIDAIDMVVRLQEISGRRADESALKEIRTVGHIVDLVEAHLRAN